MVRRSTSNLNNSLLAPSHYLRSIMHGRFASSEHNDALFCSILSMQQSALSSLKVPQPSPPHVKHPTEQQTSALSFWPTLPTIRSFLFSHITWHAGQTGQRPCVGRSHEREKRKNFQIPTTHGTAVQIFWKHGNPKYRMWSQTLPKKTNDDAITYYIQ